MASWKLEVTGILDMREPGLQPRAGSHGTAGAAAAGRHPASQEGTQARRGWARREQAGHCCVVLLL